MFLAHFSGWQYSELMEMQLEELHFWYVEARKIYDKMNPKADG